MKGFQWNKLDHRKLEGTIFKDFDDTPKAVEVKIPIFKNNQNVSFVIEISTD